jgi:hypothetical protein
VPQAPEVVEFRPGDTDAVVVRMDAIAERKQGWINVQPAVPGGDAPPQPAVLRLFSGRGPTVPVCTWVPNERTRAGVEHVQIGIQHGAGPKAVDRLADAGVPIPSTWQTFADHPKRGLVVAVPPTESNVAVLDWLLRAATALTAVPLTGTWRALVYTGG